MLCKLRGETQGVGLSGSYKVEELGCGGDSRRWVLPSSHCLPRVDVERIPWFLQEWSREKMERLKIFPLQGPSRPKSFSLLSSGVKPRSSNPPPAPALWTIWEAALGASYALWGVWQHPRF